VNQLIFSIINNILTAWCRYSPTKQPRDYGPQYMTDINDTMQFFNIIYYVTCTKVHKKRKNAEKPHKKNISSPPLYYVFWDFVNPVRLSLESN